MTRGERRGFWVLPLKLLVLLLIGKGIFWSLRLDLVPGPWNWVIRAGILWVLLSAVVLTVILRSSNPSQNR